MKNDVFKCDSCGRVTAYDDMHYVLDEEATMQCPVCRSKYSITAQLTEPGNAAGGVGEPGLEAPPEPTPDEPTPDAGGEEMPPEGGAEDLQILPAESRRRSKASKLQERHWEYRIDLSDVWPRDSEDLPSDEITRISNEIAKRLREWAVEHPGEYKDSIMDVANRFEDDVAGDAEEFDVVMNDLYEIADAANIWVKTVYGESKRDLSDLSLVKNKRSSTESRLNETKNASMMEIRKTAKRLAIPAFIRKMQENVEVVEEVSDDVLNSSLMQDIVGENPSRDAMRAVTLGISDAINEFKRLRISESRLNEEQETGKDGEVKTWSGDLAAFSAKMFGVGDGLALSMEQIEQLISDMQEKEAVAIDNDKVVVTMDKIRKELIAFMKAQTMSSIPTPAPVSDEPIGTPPPSDLPPPDMTTAAADLGSMPPSESVQESDDEKKDDETEMPDPDEELEKKVDRMLTKFFESIQNESQWGCQCSDPGCPVGHGSKECGKSSKFNVYRVDMNDEFGTLMCADCANDAAESGVFNVKSIRTAFGRRRGRYEAANPKPGTFYVTTYCNFPHRIKDGRPIGHECHVIPPAALKAEMEGDIEKAIEIMQGSSDRWVRGESSKLRPVHTLGPAGRKNRDVIIKYLDDCFGNATVGSIANETGWSRDALDTVLKDLIERGIVIREGNVIVLQRR